MTYNDAVLILSLQDRNLRRASGVRFVKDGYEYRVVYEGGFAAFVRVDRRMVGRRNFKYYTGFCGDGCRTAADLVAKAEAEISKKAV